MSKDYSKAWEASDRNAKAHIQASKRLLGEHPGFAVAHAALGFEEAAKAVYCSMVANGYVKATEVEAVFRDHNPKAFLYDEIFSSGLSIKRQGTEIVVGLDQERLAERIQKSIRREVGKTRLDSHKREKESGLYVGWSGGQVTSPQQVVPTEAQNAVEGYGAKSIALLGFAVMLSSTVKEILSRGDAIEIGPFSIVRNDRVNGEVIVSYSWS